MRWRTLSINGQVWPITERLHYTEGEQVHWRVINVSGEYHPMHLHGFYFTVKARGDTQADTVTRAPRALQVTEGMRELSAMQLTWTAARAGNWLFHCHIVVHTQGSPPDSATAAEAEQMSGMAMNDGMAGLIMGITVTPRVAVAKRPPANARRLDLWTGARQKMFGDSPAYGFVLQRGATAPPSDSTTLPSSPLVLTRGEPTMIVVHNRLPVALSLHWHGIELESYYDGVGNWSGAKGNIRAPIAAGDSLRVYINAPRAGTFMYHVHGEAGAELQQDLYGALIVLEKGQTFSSTTDRLFMLASRGAKQDVEAAINGRGLAPAERFDAGKRYRLHLMHISTNDVKTILVLKDGKPVQWRPLAHDGAALPVSMQRLVEAKVRMDVGQTLDMDWTPTETGVYVLEVHTDYLTFPGPPMQRVAFAVEPASDNDLRIAATGTTRPLAEIVGASLDKFMGAYGDASAEFVSVWTQGTGLAITRTIAGVETTPVTLIPLADGTFVPGTIENGFAKEATPLVHYRLDGTTVVRDANDVPRTGAGPLSRIKNFTLDSGALKLRFPGSPPLKCFALSRSRFWFDGGGSPVLVEFVERDGKIVTLIAAGGAFKAARLPNQ